MKRYMLIISIISYLSMIRNRFNNFGFFNFLSQGRIKSELPSIKGIDHNLSLLMNEVQKINTFEKRNINGEGKLFLNYLNQSCNVCIHLLDKYKKSENYRGLENRGRIVQFKEGEIIIPEGLNKETGEVNPNLIYGDDKIEGSKGEVDGGQENNLGDNTDDGDIPSVNTNMFDICIVERVK